jgi:hypothetical protein
MSQDIERFVNRYLAIYRPNKRTYSVIEWVQERRYWRRALLDPDHTPAINIRSHNTPPALVNINISPTLNRRKYVRCKALDKFLFYNNICVPIIQKVPGSEHEFAHSTFAGEFQCTTVSTEPIFTQPMWTLYPLVPVPVPVPVPAPVPAPAPAPVPLPIPFLPQEFQVFANLPEPIPRRIAWLVADDASKNGESCSITLDEISPITASVTTCFHVFNSDAIAKWLTTNQLCPMCKKRCQVTVAFEDGPPPLAID